MDSNPKSSSFSCNERIIPITILDSPHSKPFGQALMTLTPPPSPNHGTSSKRQSLLVTHDDGTTSEIQGIVTNLSNNCINNNINNNSGIGVGVGNNNFDKRVTIQEIGQETLEREMSKEKLQKFETPKKIEEEKFEKFEAPIKIKVIHGDPKIPESSTKPKTFSTFESPKKSGVDETSPKKNPRGVDQSPKVSVRHVPIRLDDGKIIQHDSDETMEIRTEFTNYTHEELFDKPTMTPSSTTTKPTLTPTMNHPSMRIFPEASASAKERIIPIKLESGEEIMPTFTKLDEPEPPKWSTFSKSNKENQKTTTASPTAAKEKIVPLKLEDEELGSQHEDDRGRKRTKASDDPASKSADVTDAGQRRTSRSVDRKQHTVRFNVNEETTERRSESRESYTRRSLNRSTNKSSKPPSGPSDRHSFTSGIPNRKFSGPYRPESPIVNQNRESTPDSDQKTLLDIDRDITRIWRELQELDTTKPSSKYPATPVKVKSYTIPTASQAARVSRPSATPPPPPILSSSLPTSSSSTPRTIWDTDPAGSWTPPPTTFVPHRDQVEQTRPGAITPLGRRSSSGSRSIPSYTPRISASPPVSTVTGTHLAGQRSSTPLPTASYNNNINNNNFNGSVPKSGNNLNNSNNSNIGRDKNPFLTDPIIVAPLAKSEVSPVSPTKSNNGVKNFRDKNTTTNIDDDDGIYEGFEHQPSNVAFAPKVRKSESPKKSVGTPEKSSDKFSDKSTQTGADDDDDDVDKKKKKNGSCVIL